MKIEKKKRIHQEKNDDKYKKLYFLHHMHHFQSGKNIEHELHHCFLFEKKNMAGKKYSVIHRIIGNELLHCISVNFEGKLYDHENNTYLVKVKTINSNKLSVIRV